MNKKLMDDFGLGAPPRELVRHLDKERVLRESQLKSLVRTCRRDWALAEGVAVEGLMAWMLERSRLHHLAISSEIRGSVVRYIWGDVTPLEIAFSLAPRAYFSHATAASLHGLLTYTPEMIYLNREQSAKPTPSGTLNQDAIDRAFANKQRASRDVYFWGRTRVTVLSGKNSGRLGVQQHVHDNAAVEITGLERTLIDVTVRPDYAGGPGQVLEAFRRSQTRLSVDRLLDTLASLDYRYPYHQAIGFYMQRAGYAENELAKLEAVGSNLAFYIGYGVDAREFDPKWRVHFPRNL